MGALTPEVAYILALRPKLPERAEEWLAKTLARVSESTPTYTKHRAFRSNAWEQKNHQGRTRPKRSNVWRIYGLRWMHFPFRVLGNFGAIFVKEATIEKMRAARPHKARLSLTESTTNTRKLGKVLGIRGNPALVAF